MNGAACEITLGRIGGHRLGQLCADPFERLGFIPPKVFGRVTVGPDVVIPGRLGAGAVAPTAGPKVEGWGDKLPPTSLVPTADPEPLTRFVPRLTPETVGPLKAGRTSRSNRARSARSLSRVSA